MSFGNRKTISKKTARQQIRDLKKALSKLQEENKTYHLNLNVGGKHVHTFYGFKTRKEAQLMSNLMYKVFVTKLRKKVELLIEEKEVG